MKQTWAYLRYFFYLGWNWNFRLAAVILYYEIKGEKKYRIQTTGIDELLDSVSEQDREHASIYQPVNYFIAEWLFARLTPSDIDGNTFMDAGCGRGRAMAMAAAAGFAKIFGFDISPRLCYEAMPNLQSLKNRYPHTEISIECIDAKEVTVPHDCSVIFLFNPFDKTVMEPFLKKVTDSLAAFPRKMKVLYANPECRNLWLDAGFSETFSIRKMKWLQGSVLEFDPGATK